MRAIVYERFGSPDALKLKDWPTPTPTDDEVLVKVRAASLNSWDWDLLRGRPFLVRLVGGGLFKPKHNILGGDIAGHVEAVGGNVRRFQPGDEVFGDLSGTSWGGLADYVCAPEKLMAAKSPKMTFEEAAAIPQAGLLALQGLRKKEIKSGDRILINGAGGGFGTFAIQIAKMYDAEVTGVDHADKAELMRSLGADHLIDYASENYTKTGQRYDFIIDAVANRSVFDYARALSPTGAFVVVGGTMTALLQAAFVGPMLSKPKKKHIEILGWRPSADDLDHMRKLFDAGKVKPVIDRCYPLSEAATAFHQLGEGRVKGKVVIVV